MSNHGDGPTRYSLLSDRAINHRIKQGSIVIEPYHSAQLGTASYDVTLGPHYFREQQPEVGQGVYNPYDEKMVRRVWGESRIAQSASEWMESNTKKLNGIFQNDLIIWVEPGETILGHTMEFLGGRDTVNTMMKARSSMGRNFIETCKCAGWGDIGYVNRWTMEITNNSRHYSIPLIVGRRIAQIVFFETDGPTKGRSYADEGKYQVTPNVEELKSAWVPESMLPKMYLDREVQDMKSNS